MTNWPKIIKYVSAQMKNTFILNIHNPVLSWFKSNILWPQVKFYSRTYSSTISFNVVLTTSCIMLGNSSAKKSSLARSTALSIEPGCNSWKYMLVSSFKWRNREHLLIWVSNWILFHTKSWKPIFSQVVKPSSQNIEFQ